MLGSAAILAKAQTWFGKELVNFTLCLLSIVKNILIQQQFQMRVSYRQLQCDTDEGTVKFGPQTFVG